MSPTLSRGITHANVLMTLLIVCMHAIWIDETRLLPLFVLTNAAVPTFFVISSLLYFQHWQPTWACYRQKLLSRVRSLLVPYLLYNVLFYGYYVVKIHVLHMPTTKVIPTDTLGEALLCILQSVPDGVLWYVRDLFLFALIAPLIGLVLRKSRILSAVLTAASLGCFLLPYENLFFWTPCLLAGCYVALNADTVVACFGRLHHSLTARRAGMLLTIAGVPAVCCAMASIPWDSLPFYLYRMSAPLFVAVAFCAFGSLLPERWVGHLSPLTFFIYCTHPAFVDAAKALVLYGPLADVTMPLAVRYGLVVLCTLLPMVLCAVAVRRLTPWLWRPLTGYRAETRHNTNTITQ